MKTEQQIKDLNLALQKNKVSKVLEIIINVLQVVTLIIFSIVYYFSFRTLTTNFFRYALTAEVYSFYIWKIIWMLLLLLFVSLPGFILKIISIVFSVKAIGLYRKVDDSYKNRIAPNALIFVGFFVKWVFGLVGAIQFEKEIKHTLENVQKSEKELLN